MKNKLTSKVNRIDLYKNKMEEIGFMAEHLDDVPEIFDIRSEKCKLFLVKTFTVLNSNFHYLSFLGQDSIGQELAKAAFILRIYPSNNYQKSSEIFQNMNDMEIHRFWMRFFKLCKINSFYVDSNSVKKPIGNFAKINSIFSDINKTLQYFNYDLSVGNPKKLDGIDIQKEVESWIPSSFLISANESSITSNNPDLALQEKHHIHVDTDKLISDMDYIKKKTDFESFNNSSPSYPYKEYFEDFNQAVKVTINYRDNINLISTFNIDNLIKNTKLHKDSYWLSNNCQVKRCHNIIQNIHALNEKTS